MTDDQPFITHEGKTFTENEVRKALDLREAFLAPGRAVQDLGLRIRRWMDDNPELFEKLSLSEMADLFDKVAPEEPEEEPMSQPRWMVIEQVAQMYALTGDMATEFCKDQEIPVREDGMVDESYFLHMLSEFGGPDAVKRWYYAIVRDRSTGAPLPGDAFNLAEERYGDGQEAAGEEEPGGIEIHEAPPLRQLLDELTGLMITQVGYGNPGPGNETLILHLTKNKMLVIRPIGPSYPGGTASLNISLEDKG